jgi:leader peptidase (prepilin peptidase) / N-methyltransferase
LLSETFKLFFSSWYVYMIFGMIFGSFMNVVIYRVPNGLSIISPPSSCPKCGHKILWFENMPVLSWLFLRGKCSECKQPISIEYPIVEIIVGLITLGLFLYSGPSLILIIYIPLAYTLFCILVIDYKTYSIPHGLNITLFVVCASGVLLDLFFNKFPEINLLYSIFGGFAGFTILLLIQYAGKIIYKQDAVGTGDLFLLGSCGLLLGPKLVVAAFILGSLTAVLSYAVPSMINLKKRRSESVSFKNIADELNYIPVGIDEELDLLSLKMQLSFNLHDNKYDTFKQELIGKSDSVKIANLTLLRIFFRFAAVENKVTAEKYILDLDLKEENIVSDIKAVINEDLIGYDSPKDNLELIVEYSKSLQLDELNAIINENKENILKDEYSDSLAEIDRGTDAIDDNSAMLNYLLRYNRYFQFNGFTSEQQKIISMVENKIDFSEAGIKQKFLGDAAYVYFKDFFFRDSRKMVLELLELFKKESPVLDSVKSLYKISLFRLVFYKQRLAFGPFLAIGVMLSLLWGNDIISAYYRFLERFFL